MTRFARHLGAACAMLVLLLSSLTAPSASAGAAPASSPDTTAAQRAMSHKNPKMVDISTPYYNGYSKRLKAYKFTVYGRWNPVCDGKFCWDRPCVNCSKQDMGSNDAARIRFSDAVSFKKMAIQNLGACGTKYFSDAKRFSSGSFEDAYAGVNDQVVRSWGHSESGGTVQDDGYCKRPELPTTSGAAGGGGGSATYKIWGDLKGRAFKFTVWINPLPSRGRCYDRLYVKAGYTHTWTDQSLTWSAGYPWGIGVGTTSTDGSFTTWQNQDGYKDPQLKTPRVCHH